MNLFKYLLRIGDDMLIHGHRLSEWCGHAPMIEEDIALANIALDCIGQSNIFLEQAALINDSVKDQDELAFRRTEREFTNLQLVEQPNEDFAYTVVKLYWISEYYVLLFDKLRESNNQVVRAVAEKSLKEVKYHLRHSRTWVLRLGDGTTESNDRIQNAADDLWVYTGEMFEDDDLTKDLSEKGIAVLNSSIKAEWQENVSRLFEQAKLKLPESGFFVTGGRIGNHSEFLGHILSEMQYLQRTFPDAQW